GSSEPRCCSGPSAAIQRSRSRFRCLSLDARTPSRSHRVSLALTDPNPTIQELGTILSERQDQASKKSKAHPEKHEVPSSIFHGSLVRRWAKISFPINGTISNAVLSCNSNRRGTYPF